MLIHVEANQFFLNSIQIIHDVQANQFFLDSSIQIVQNGRGDEVSPLSRKVSPQLVRGLHIPIPLSLLFFSFFSRVAACNQPKFRAVNQYSNPPNPSSDAPFPRHRSFRFPKLPPHRLRGVITRQPRAFSFPSPRNFPFSSTTSSRWGRTLLAVSGGIRISEVDLIWISRELCSDDNIGEEMDV